MRNVLKWLRENKEADAEIKEKWELMRPGVKYNEPLTQGDLCRFFAVGEDVGVNYISFYLTKAPEMGIDKDGMDNFKVAKRKVIGDHQERENLLNEIHTEAGMGRKRKAVVGNDGASPTSKGHSTTSKGHSNGTNGHSNGTNGHEDAVRKPPTLKTRDALINWLKHQTKIKQEQVDRLKRQLDDRSGELTRLSREASELVISIAANREKKGMNTHAHARETTGAVGDMPHEFGRHDSSGVNNATASFAGHMTPQRERSPERIEVVHL